MRGLRTKAWLESALPWVLAIAVFVLADDQLALGTSALIMILFTLSVDLVLGRAGIITLGQAAFLDWARTQRGSLRCTSPMLHCSACSSLRSSAGPLELSAAL